MADAVTDWNAIAVPAVAGRTCPGPIGIVDLALVHAAVHDAVQAIEGRFQPYHVKISGAAGSPAAAAAAAAYGVLIGFYPGQAGVLTPAYQAYLSGNNLVNDPGLAVGQIVAAAILPLRRLDPSPLPTPFTGGTSPGEWRPDRVVHWDTTRAAPFFRSRWRLPWYGAFQPFTLKSPTQYRAPKPPVLNSARYAHEYDEVKALGGTIQQRPDHGADRPRSISTPTISSRSGTEASEPSPPSMSITSVTVPGSSLWPVWRPAMPASPRGTASVTTTIGDP